MGRNATLLEYEFIINRTSSSGYGLKIISNNTYLHSDDCFANQGPAPTIFPTENITIDVTLPPGFTTPNIPTVDELRDQLDDFLFSNDSCLVKDITKCPERNF